MMKLVLRAIAVAFSFTLLGAASAAAQAPPPATAPASPEAGVSFERNVDIKIMGAGPGNFEFMTAPISFESEPVAGAPYSAEAITEVVQPLADGNRIVNQSKAQLARDSVGRTRREQGLSVLGPMVNDPFDDRHVQITDPETHTIIMLDLEHRTAHRMPAPNIRVMAKLAGGVAVTTQRLQSAGEPATGGFEMALPAPPPLPGAAGGVNMFYSSAGKGGMPEPRIESLGKQFMEGVDAEGTRTTFTIPAGQIGNDLPINVVSERWFSPELKVLVMSRQSDPRFGETTYRLTSVVRGEPSAALFEVPADFKVVDENPERDFIFRTEK